MWVARWFFPISDNPVNLMPLVEVAVTVKFSLAAPAHELFKRQFRILVIVAEQCFDVVLAKMGSQDFAK